MLRNDETTLVLHGLDEDNRIVRAPVFVQKLRGLLQALQAADKTANGRNSFDYVITRLETHSASVTIREKQRRRGHPQHSSIDYFERTATAIYNGDRNLVRLPPVLVRNIQKLSDGVAKNFSQPEIVFADENVIRIDDFLQRQAEVAYEVAMLPEAKHADRFYRGIATGAFDGLLKEIDARGTMLRGKLVLSAGGAEIDCVMNKDRVPEARESFDKRVIIEGTAHYDGGNQIPSRIDVRAIKVLREGADLLRWRGAFRSPEIEDADDEWQD
jgi:hypothetical protein